ncbi:Ribonuclease H-like domain containing protein [Parasponia andersonii]|uniref:Ribonuclease H-like domain containing protein n=1 Tax=Parasponia andersonii TaxID=3476 RepID=A0A2P5AI42_PARAD|nr:Ribonuclease H-like domain containing protein [Parasponia andersonii]
MTDLLILQELWVKSKSRKASIIVEVIWRPPPLPWVKINTDGSTNSSPGFSECSEVFQTHKGFIQESFFISLGICYAFEAELAAAIRTIDFVWKYGWKLLWLESDLVYIVSSFLARSLKVPFHWRSA